jgi:SAM-dependent methyltransferase
MKDWLKEMISHGGRHIPGKEEFQCQYHVLLDDIKDIFVGKSIVDMCCHSGQSTKLTLEYGAASATGFDLSEAAINIALKAYTDPNIKFECHDISDHDYVSSLVSQAQIVTSFGNFYHMHDHYRLLKIMCQPNIEYLVLDSLYGPETNLPSMVWQCHQPMSGLGYRLPANIPKGTPNISWIAQVCDIFGFKLDYVHKYYSTVNFDTVVDHDANKRMMLKFYNSKLIDKNTYLKIDDVWEWSDNQLIQQI